jgi:hypothetical protein
MDCGAGAWLQWPAERGLVLVQPSVMQDGASSHFATMLHHTQVSARGPSGSGTCLLCTCSSSSCSFQATASMASSLRPTAASAAVFCILQDAQPGQAI